MEKPVQTVNQGNIISSDENNEAVINLSNHQVLALDGLTNEQISELRQQHISGMIDIQKKAAELKVDVSALDAALNSFNEQTSRASQLGASATISHTQTTSIGRTEVVMGNTDKAAQGKISRSARGETDNTLKIVGIIAATAIVVAMIFSN